MGAALDVENGVCIGVNLVCVRVVVLQSNVNYNFAARRRFGFAGKRNYFLVYYILSLVQKRHILRNAVFKAEFLLLADALVSQNDAHARV